MSAGEREKGVEGKKEEEEEGEKEEEGERQEQVVALFEMLRMYASGRACHSKVMAGGQNTSPKHAACTQPWGCLEPSSSPSAPPTSFPAWACY